MAIYGHNFDVFVGKFFNTASKTTADLTAATGDTSEFGIELEDTGLLATTTALTTGDIFRVVQKNTDGTLKASPYIKFDNIRKGSTIEDGDASNTNYIAEAQQVSNIGYTDVNTSNSVEAINSNRYTIRLNFTNDTEVYSEQKEQYFFEYVSDANTVQAEVVNYFAQKISKVQYLADGSTSGASRARVKVERFFSTTTESATASVTGTFTQGSTTVSFSGTHNVAVGDYVRVATGAGSPVYKCVEVIATDGSIVIDQPYQGTSATTGSGAVKRVTAATAEGSANNAGLKITGLDQFYKVGLYPYSVVSFNVAIDGFGSTVSDTSTTPAKGNSVAKAIADIEWFSLSKNSPGSGTWTGNGFPSVETYAELKADTANSQVYDVLSIDYVLTGNDSNAISAGGSVKGTLVFALPGDADSLQDHLEDLFANVDGISGSDLADS